MLKARKGQSHRTGVRPARAAETPEEAERQAARRGSETESALRDEIAELRARLGAVERDD